MAVDDPTQIAAVAHRHQRQRNHREVAYADDAFARAEAGSFHFLADHVVGGEPECGGLQVLRRNVDGAEADVFTRGEFDFFEGDGLPSDVGVAVGKRCLWYRGACIALAGDADVAFEYGLCVVVGFAAFDVSDLALEVEFSDEVRFAVVEVDGFRVDELGGADGVDVGDDGVVWCGLGWGLARGSTPGTLAVG